MDKIVLGIDPGVYGGLVFINATQHTILGYRMPHYIETKTTKTKKGNFRQSKHVCPEKIAKLIKKFDISAAYLEKVHAMPHEGVTSAFSFGKGVGVLIGILASEGIPTSHITPNKWKADLKVPANKDKAIARAKILFPKCHSLFDTGNKQYNSGIAESAMISLWGCFMENISFSKKLELGNE